MHAPFALTPLAQDMFLRSPAGPSRRGTRCSTRPSGCSRRGLQRLRLLRLPEERAGRAGEGRRTSGGSRSTATRSRCTGGSGTTRSCPSSRRSSQWIAALPVDDLLGEERPRPGSRRGRKGERSWVLHFIAIMGPYQVLEDLVGAYAVGDGPGPRRGGARARPAAGTTSSRTSKRASSRWPRWRPAPRAASSRRRSRRPPRRAAGRRRSISTALRALPGGDAFVDELERVPRDPRPPRARTTTTCCMASWAEAPRLLLRAGSRRGSATPAPPAREREAALARRADELADAVRAALAGQAGRAGEIRDDPRARARHRLADRGPQLLDRPAVAGASARSSRCASVPASSARASFNAAGRRLLPPPRRDRRRPARWPAAPVAGRRRAARSTPGTRHRLGSRTTSARSRPSRRTGDLFDGPRLDQRARSTR